MERTYRVLTQDCDFERVFRRLEQDGLFQAFDCEWEEPDFPRWMAHCRRPDVLLLEGCIDGMPAGLLKLIPGTEDALAEFMLDRYDGLIIESFGVGGLPEYDGGHLYDVVRRGVERGKIVVMTTQVPNEGSDLTVYHVGGHLKSTLRLLEAYDMTTEAAVAKLMWIMGQTREFSEVERLFYQPVAQDILRFGDE